MISPASAAGASANTPIAATTLRAIRLATVRIRIEERVAVVARGEEGLLHRPGADPADQIPHRPRLVVRPRRARAAERLLPDDCARRLVVDVEVAGGVAEPVGGLVDRGAVLAEDGAGQAVGRGAVDEVERLVPRALVVDIRRHDRSEQLLLQQPELRIPRLDHRRVDEESAGVVVAAANHDVALRIALRLLDRVALRGERVAVDHGAHEVPEVGDIADLDRRHLLLEPLPQLRPQVRRRVHPRGGGALLPLVLERAADDRGRQRVDVRGRMRDDEVLAARLADDARVVAVAIHVLADRAPHAVEHGRRACEVDAREVLAPEDGVADRRAGAVDEVDHAVRQPRLLEEAHQVVGRQHRRRRRLPHDRVPHQRRRAGQVPGDRREVERADREDEALERPVLHPVPHPRRRSRLLAVDPRHELDVEAEEVDQLARGVDLGLVRRLRLAEHRSGVERVAPRAGEQLGGAEEDSGTLLPRPARPVLPRLRGGVDRRLHVLSAALVDVGKDVLLVVGHHGRARVAGGDVLAADHERDLDALVAHLLEPQPEPRALGAARREVVHGLVEGGRRPEDRMRAHAPYLRDVDLRGSRGGRAAVRRPCLIESARRGYSSRRSRYVAVTTTQIMKPRDEAHSVECHNVQSAAASAKPTARTATPPAIPRRPNPRDTFRARSAARDDATTTAAAQPAPGAARRTSWAASPAPWRAMNDAPPRTTTLAKKPSGSNRTSKARRLPRNQRYANAATVKTAVAARSWSPATASARTPSAT